MNPRRHPPEDRGGFADAPLFDFEARTARERADLGMGRASEKAERVEPGWKHAALEAVLEHAQQNEEFLAENVPVIVPVGADPRAVGAVFQQARRRGWIRPDGFAPANSSNRSAKVRWRSLVYRERP